MAKGDHIYRSMKISGRMTTHHGIDCGDGTVIHYHGTITDQKIIRLVSRYVFADGETIFTEKYGKCDSPEVVVQRAISKLGEQKYNLLFNNCEHFAHYCKTGRSDSKQVNKFVAPIGGVGGGSLIAAAVAAPAVLGIAAAIGIYHLSKND
ncbi:lecithin retinol acyltransferase family protein [Anabaena sp. CCY 0017]|uniref:lecithin retinol acyltransferase family protein n=1 Tax=Anabaena sp. CCY 0017 TaxID=3103866 RepID=UPI0039C6A891